jgi:hypothetical protein
MSKNQQLNAGMHECFYGALMSKNQQLIKKALEKLGHTGVEVIWERNCYYYRSDQTKNAYKGDMETSWVALRRTFEATMAGIGEEKYWLGVSRDD